MRRVSCKPMTSHPRRSYALKTSSVRPNVVRGNCDLPFMRTCSIPRFALSQEATLCSASPPPFACQQFPPSRDFFYHPSFPVPVLVLYFGLTTWVQPSQPASLRSSYVSRANLVLNHRLLSSSPLSAAVRQLWCHGRWYERSDLWIQLAMHRRYHRLYRYDHSTPGLLTVSLLQVFGSITAGMQPGQVYDFVSDSCYDCLQNTTEGLGVQRWLKQLLPRSWAERSNLFPPGDTS